MKIHYLQHETIEDPGSILEWASLRRHTVTSTRLFDREPLPGPDSFDMLVIMGGSMSVYDEERYPWLAPEKEIIGRAIGQDKAVLGVCLGAQLIASALGARVHKNPCKEIGWFPVSLTSDGAASPFCRGWPSSFTAFHWHGDTFDLPKGARWTAFSKATKNQAFEYGTRTVALQYHIEATPEGVERFAAACTSDLVSESLYVQPAEEMRDFKTAFPFIRKQLFQLLDTFDHPELP
ncbi:MAG: type 1 glutamine amidotransferase [Chitinispirillaceae bacterium]|nr:type 1 glutamine amidotransferase [Chitinispirillaceae bacterium]